jgi:hypothetical protein
MTSSWRNWRGVTDTTEASRAHRQRVWRRCVIHASTSEATWQASWLKRTRVHLTPDSCVDRWLPIKKSPGWRYLFIFSASILLTARRICDVNQFRICRCHFCLVQVSWSHWRTKCRQNKKISCGLSRFFYLNNVWQNYVLNVMCDSEWPVSVSKGLPSCGFVRISLPMSLCHKNIYTMVFVESWDMFTFLTVIRIDIVALRAGASTPCSALMNHVQPSQ